MANKITGEDVQFQSGDGATPTEAFTTIAQVQNITPPGESLNPVDVTNMDSGGISQFIGGLLDYGEASVELIWDPDDTGQEGLRTDMRNKIARNFKIVFPAPVTKTWSFTALVSNIGPTVPLEDKLSATFTFKLDGSSSAIA